MKIKLILVILLLSLSGIYLNMASAGSFYNSHGLGELKYFSHAQAIGLGGSLIAIPDRFQINLLNPAGLVFIPITRLSGDFIHEAIWNKTETGTGFAKYTNLNGISLALPIRSSKLVTSLSIIPTSQFDYEYQLLGTVNDFNYTKKIRASGGLNKVSFGFGYAITDHIYLGSYLQYNFGKLAQNWIVDYVSDLFWDTSDKLTRKMWGMNWTGGFIIRPVSELYFGAVYSGKYKLTCQDHTENMTQKSSLIYVVSSSTGEEKKLTIPQFWGFGICYVLNEKYRLSADYLYQPWSNFKKENDFTTNYNNSYQIGAGVEMLPSKNILAKYYQKMTYRLGYFFHALDFQDETGSSVAECGITAGTGFPYYGTLGRVDIALRFGRRGNISSNPVEESIFQLYISITGGEKWFLRGN